MKCLISIYLCILSQPRDEDFRTGAQRHRAKKKERIKSKIGKVIKLKSSVTQDAKNSPLLKRLRVRSVISVNYHYITVLSPFNLLIRFKCCSVQCSEVQCKSSVLYSTYCAELFIASLFCAVLHHITLF